MPIIRQSSPASARRAGEDQEVEDALDRLRAWRERGSPDSEIDDRDAPATHAPDWLDAERVSIRFRKRP